MEDTASSSLRFVGETIPESKESSLGWTPPDVPTGELPRGVTGLRTTETRNFGDADAGSTANSPSGESISNPGASGSQATVDASHQQTVAAGRALSPKRAQSAELRAHFARLHQTRVVRNVQIPDSVPEVPVPRDTVSRREADATLAQLQKQISDATQRTEDLVTAAADTRKTAEVAGQIATHGATGVARTNAGLEQMVLELRNELQTIREKIEDAENRASDARHIADSAEQCINKAQYAADAVEQRVEMQSIGDVADKVMGHVEKLTATFHRFDEERRRGNVVNSKSVKSTPAHVQGTPSIVKEPVGHVQSEPTSVIDLVSLEKEGWKSELVREYIGRVVEENMEKVRADIRLGKSQPADMIPEVTDDSSPVWMTSATTSTDAARHMMHEKAAHVSTSSREVRQTGEPYCTPTIHEENPSTREVVVTKPPSLPSGTQKVIEGIMEAYLKKIGIQQEPQEPEEFSRTVVGSTVGKIPNIGPETTQFSFQQMQDIVAPTQGQQVFATAQWKPREPPMFTGAATDDVYLWTSLVKQYFVFMRGDAQQEVAFAATLLRGAAHEWYMGYEKRNGNKPARDWPTLRQAILERFGSNIREQEAHAKLLTVSQGKRSVRDYTSEFETLLGRLSTRDEETWKRMYVWGLQPHLGKAVALKYPTTIAQAAGHAEEIELAIRASQRPNLNQPGARATVTYSARGGSSAAPRPFVQGRGRGNVGPTQRGGQGYGGRRGGSWNRGRHGGFRGNRRGGSGRRARYSGLNVIYDTEGNEYPIDENGNLVIEFIEENDATTSHQKPEKSGN